MQTAFSKAQLRIPKIADAKNILTDCVHFGFCTAVCPTYVLLRDEMDAIAVGSACAMDLVPMNGEQLTDIRFVVYD